MDIDRLPKPAVKLLSYRCPLTAGVVVRQAGRSIVIAPPLIIQKSEIDEICDRLVRSLDASIRVKGIRG